MEAWYGFPNWSDVTKPKTSSPNRQILVFKHDQQIPGADLGVDGGDDAVALGVAQDFGSGNGNGGLENFSPADCSYNTS